MCYEQALRHHLFLYVAITSIFLDFSFFGVHTILGPLTESQELAFRIFYYANGLLVIPCFLAFKYVQHMKPNPVQEIVIFTGFCICALLSYISAMKFLNVPTQSEMTDYFEFYRKYEVKTTPTFLDIAQAELNCCGIKSYLDYKETESIQPHPGTIYNRVNFPDSCCKIHQVGCGKRFSLDISENLLQKRLKINGCFVNGFEDFGPRYTRVYKIIWAIPITVLGFHIFIILFFLYQVRHILHAALPNQVHPVIQVPLPSGSPTSEGPVEVITVSHPS